MTVLGPCRLTRKVVRAELEPLAGGVLASVLPRCGDRTRAEHPLGTATSDASLADRASQDFSVFPCGSGFWQEAGFPASSPLRTPAGASEATFLLGEGSAMRSPSS